MNFTNLDFLIPLFHTLNLSITYSLLFAFIDLYYIKWYRNLTKQDKRLTILYKSFFVAITGYSVIIREPYLIPTLILTIWLLFDSLIGLYLYKSIFRVGSNSNLDDFGDNLDSKDDNIAKVYWYSRLALIVISIFIYYVFFYKFN